jgi:transcriptional regulator with XRE-family HTH domain
MSLSLGQNSNYINQIENYKTLPSMQSFFYICEFLKVTPQEFFDYENNNPIKNNDLINDLKRLDEKSLSHVTGIIKELARKK